MAKAVVWGPSETPWVKEVEIDIGLRKRSPDEKFLKGPIPLGELAPVVRLPGKALALWLLVRHRVDVTGDEWVTISQNALAEFGVSKRQKIEGLRRLERAGLVEVARPKGLMLKVKLIKRRGNRK